MYFKAHPCLTAYMDILRKNFSATFSSSQTVVCDVMTVDPISVRHY